MSLKIVDDKYFIFTYNVDSLGDLSEGDISEFLKDIFIFIGEVYSIKLAGYFKVDLFIDKKVGIFVEIEKIDEFVSYSKKIDTKVSISVCDFYLKTNDLSVIKDFNPIYYYNDSYYVSTDSLDNVFDLMDFCEIEYNNCYIKDIVM